MQRRFNYTGRKRIDRKDVRISLTSEEGDITFDANLDSLRKYDLPKDASVFVEAYRQTNWMRFHFGNIGAISPPHNRALAIFDSPEGIHFRVKVTASGTAHNILAEADGIPLLASDAVDDERTSLLPVKPQKGMKEVFRVDFSGTEPILLINSDIGSYTDIVTSPIFAGIAYPAILREILTRIVIVDEQEESDELDNWKSRWMKFCNLLPSVIPFVADGTDDDKTEWIDSVVSSFAKKIDAAKKFNAAWEGGS
jgi:hypothetical protein